MGIYFTGRERVRHPPKGTVVLPHPSRKGRGLDGAQSIEGESAMKYRTGHLPSVNRVQQAGVDVEGNRKPGAKVLRSQVPKG